MSDAGPLNTKHTIHVFATPSNAPRVRRATDAIGAAVAVALAAVLALVADERSSFDDSLTRLVSDLPGWILWLSQSAYVVGLAYGALLLLGVAFVARSRKRMARDLVVSAAGAVLAAVALAQLVDGRWPDMAITQIGEPATTFPAILITALIAMQSNAAPQLSEPMRRLGWVLTTAAVVGGLLGGMTEIRDTAGAVLVALAVAALVRLAFGTTAGEPSLNRVRDGLLELGLGADDLAYTEGRLAGAVPIEAHDSVGPVAILVVGRDSWNSSFLHRAWRSAWYQDTDSDLGASRRQQVEHAALVLLVAKEGGVAVPDLLAVGVSSVGDAILATRSVGTKLSDLDTDKITDGVLEGAWQQVAKLHAAAASHGSLSPDHIAVTDPGHVVLTAFGRGHVGASAEQKSHDIAMLLTSTALLVGAERAIAAMRNVLSDDTISAALPILQPAAMPAALRHEIKQQKFDVGDLRQATATAMGTDPPELEKLQRVSLGKVVMVAITTFAVYGIISGLADIGFDTIADSLRDATWSLVLIAFVVVQFTNMTDAASIVAASPKPLPIGITGVEQMAIGFVNLAVPSSAGRIAVNVRYFEKFGINAAQSSTASVITSIAGFIVQASLFLITLIGGDQNIDFSQLETDGGVLRVLEFAVAIVVVGFIVMMIVPKLRHWLADKIRKPLADVESAMSVLKSPKTVAVIFGGKLGTQLLFAAGLTICVYAVGAEVSFGEVILINTVVSLFAGMMPIPGGIGVTEAGLTAGLTATGIDNGTALSAVLIYRMCTYYLPPIWGWVSMRWLTRHDYL